uniref:Uncharacterized protein n=1 Tax=Arundo donax TaxID=35708 RepID=A0A0A9C2W2_ARUDO
MASAGRSSTDAVATRAPPTLLARMLRVGLH